VLVSPLPQVRTVTWYACKTQGKRYNTIGAGNPETSI
jgi:hypothetical protein